MRPAPLPFHLFETCHPPLQLVLNYGARHGKPLARQCNELVPPANPVFQRRQHLRPERFLVGALQPAISPRPHIAQGRQGKWPEWFCRTPSPSPPHRCSRCGTQPASPHCRIPPAGSAPKAGQCIDATASGTSRYLRASARIEAKASVEKFWNSSMNR